MIDDHVYVFFCAFFALKTSCIKAPVKGNSSASVEGGKRPSGFGSWKELIVRLVVERLPGLDGMKLYDEGDDARPSGYPVVFLCGSTHVFTSSPMRSSLVVIIPSLFISALLPLTPPVSPIRFNLLEDDEYVSTVLSSSLLSRPV